MIPKPPKPKKARDKKKRLEKKGLALWKQLIIQENPLCEGCSDEPTITGHHFWYRSSYGHILLDLDNGIGIGLKCHGIIHNKWQLDNKKIVDTIREKRGEEWYFRLKRKAFNKPTPSYKTLTWLQQQIELLK